LKIVFLFDLRPFFQGESDDPDEQKTLPRTRKRKLTDGMLRCLKYLIFLYNRSVGADKSSASPAPSARRYQSAYRPQLLRNSSPPLQYESHPFKKTTFKINEVGEATRVNSNEVETILVAQDWQLHRKGSVPRDGYIAKGYSKYAFRVCTDSLHRNPYTDPRITE